MKTKPVSNRTLVQKYVDSNGVCLCVEHLPGYLQPQCAADLLRDRVADYVKMPLGYLGTCEACEPTA